MANFTKTQNVKLNAVVPEGPVQAMRMDADGNVEYLVGWVDSAGVAQERWFAEAELVAA